MTELLSWVQDHATTFMVSVRRILVQVAILISAVLLLLWLAVFLYGSFYYSYMPSVSFSTPVPLIFRTDCGTEDVLCSYPTANVSLLRNGKEKVMMYGQSYRISLWLLMPESPVNQNLGMFMVQMSCYTKAGAGISTISRSAMLHYKSWLLQTLNTLLYAPLFVTGLVEQAQVVDIELHSDYIEDSYAPTIGAVIEVQSKRVEIYKAQLQIRAYFTGIRYLLYSFPVTSAIIGVATNFTFLCVLVLASYLHVVWGGLWPPERAGSESGSHQRPSTTPHPSPVQHAAGAPHSLPSPSMPTSSSSSTTSHLRSSSILRHLPPTSLRQSLEESDVAEEAIDISMGSRGTVESSSRLSQYNPTDISTASRGTVESSSRLSQYNPTDILMGSRGTVESSSRVSQYNPTEISTHSPGGIESSSRSSQYNPTGLPLETVGVTELPSAAFDYPAEETSTPSSTTSRYPTTETSQQPFPLP